MTDRGVISLLAHVIAGRKMDVAAIDGPQALSHTDGETIFFGSADGAAPGDAWFAPAFQAALLSGPSLAPVHMRRLLGKSAAASRYLLCEAARLARDETMLMPPKLRRKLARIAPEVTPRDSADSLAIALSDTALPDGPAYLGRIRPMLLLARTAARDGLGALRREPQDSEESLIANLIMSPLMRAKKALDGLFGGKPEKTGSTDEGAIEIAVGTAGRRNWSAASSPSHAPSIEAEAAIRTAATFDYPEWDHARGRYRHDWVTVVEHDLPTDTAATAESALGGASLSTAFQRALAPMGLSNRMVRGETDGTDLDTGALIEAAIDRASGRPDEAPRIYRRSMRRRRDLGVLVVLDISGSTEEGMTEAGGQFDQQRQTAYHLGKAVHDLGDAVEIIAFNSWGRRQVHCGLLKPYSEPWSTKVAQRFARLQPAGFTRLGAIIRHATMRLTETIRQPYRLIVIVTDGLAYDAGYEDIAADADVRMALAEARAANVGCLCLSVASATGDERLREAFGDTSLVTVAEPRQLIPRIAPAVRSALDQLGRRKLGLVDMAADHG